MFDQIESTRRRKVVKTLAVFALLAWLFILTAALPFVMHTIATGALCVAASAAWVFVFFYHRRAWRTYREGVHLMWTTVAFASILTYSASVTLFSNVPVRPIQFEYPRTVIFLTLAALFVWRVRLLGNDHTRS